MFKRIIGRICSIISKKIGRSKNGALPDGGELVADYIIFNEAAFENILVATGKESEFRDKKIRCPECNSIVEWENLRAIIPNNGTFDFMCDEPTCYDKYFYKRSGG